MAVLYHNNFEDTTNFSDVTPRMALTANNEQTFVVPGVVTNNLQALFEYASDSSVFVGYNTAAIIPAPNAMDTATRIEFKPKKRFVRGGDVLHFATPDAVAYVGISFRSLP